MASRDAGQQVRQAGPFRRRAGAWPARRGGSAGAARSRGPRWRGVTPSAISISAERMWSATTRMPDVVGVVRIVLGFGTGVFLAGEPAALSRTGRTWSVSYMFSTPCRISASRSRPRPVSMFFLGSSPRISKSSLRVHSPHLVLHEDEVPDLDVAGVISGGAALHAVGGTAVVVDLRAGAGGAGLAGGPVVVLLAHPLDPLGRQARRPFRHSRAASSSSW